MINIPDCSSSCSRVFYVQIKGCMKDEKSNLSLGDESYTIILNTTAPKKKIPAELLPFYMYVNQLDIDDNDELVREIHEQVVELNNDSDWRDALMTWEEMLEEKLEEGYEEGFEKGMSDGVQKGLQQGIEQGIEQGIQQGKQQGLEQGIQQGKNEMLVKLIKSGNLSYDLAKSISDDPIGLEDLLTVKRSRIYEPFDYDVDPDIPF